MTRLMTIGLVLACASGVQTEPVHGQSVDPSPDRLLSSNRAEREESLKELSRLYFTTRHELDTEVLQEAMRSHREDDRYMSPLHCAIQAVDAWRVFEAEDSLVTIIDYQLDVASFPLGIRVLGDYFYPAAGALVRLRVDTRKVVNAMGVMPNESERRLRLLTWVLAERVRSLDAARDILEPAARGGGPGPENLRRAIKFLNDAEHVADLLPPYADDADEEEADGESGPDN